jgi:hypothetical protein
MISFIEAIALIMRLLDANLGDRDLAEWIKAGLARYFTEAQLSAFHSAAKILREVLKPGEVAGTGKRKGEALRGAIRADEWESYYLDLFRGELSNPQGYSAEDFPRITAVLINKESLLKVSGPKVKAIAAPRKPGPSPVATERVKVAMRDYAATQSVSALRSKSQTFPRSVPSSPMQAQSASGFSFKRPMAFWHRSPFTKPS